MRHILKDGKLKLTADAERFTGVWCGSEVPFESLQACHCTIEQALKADDCCYSCLDAVYTTASARMITLSVNTKPLSSSPIAQGAPAIPDYVLQSYIFSDD